MIACQHNSMAHSESEVQSYGDDAPATCHAAC